MSGTRNPSSLPVNSVERNACWTYPVTVQPRFAGAPALTEIKERYKPPIFDELPDGAEVTVKLYGGAVTISLDCSARRVYTERFVFVSFQTEGEARAGLKDLWDTLRPLSSAADAQAAANRWREVRSGS